MRRDFILPEEDVEFLNSTGLAWETVASGGNWVIIHNYPVPEGYTLTQTNVAVRIDPGYPNTQIDMVYFSPNLSRKDGKVIGALAMIGFDNKNWQRWSRHRTPLNPWRPGVDSIITHFALINHWLEREFNIR